MLPQIVALFAASSEDGQAANGRVDEAQCRQLTGFAKSGFEHCDLSLLANGTAPCVAVVYDCGAHLCSVDYFIWYGKEQAPYTPALAQSSGFEVSPDHRYLIRSDIFHEQDVPFNPSGGATFRFDRRSGKSERIADCFSTRLSPNARWYVCRDLGGNVLRFPVQGGKLQTVVTAKLPDGERLKLGGAFDDYPTPVRFPSATELEYDLYLLESENVVTLRAEWRE
jgi:hypothetical protein